MPSNATEHFKRLLQLRILIVRQNFQLLQLLLRQRYLHIRRHADAVEALALIGQDRSGSQHNRSPIGEVEYLLPLSIAFGDFPNQLSLGCSD